MADDLEVCPDHAHLPIQLQEIKDFFEENDFLTYPQITYLIGQAQHAINLGYAGEQLNISSSRYIATLEEAVTAQNEEIGSLRDTIDHLREQVADLTPEEE